MRLRFSAYACGLSPWLPELSACVMHVACACVVCCAFFVCCSMVLELCSHSVHAIEIVYELRGLR